MAAFAAPRAFFLATGPMSRQVTWTAGTINLQHCGTLLKNISQKMSVVPTPVKPEPPRLSFGILKAIAVMTSGTVTGAFLASYIAGCLEQFDVYIHKEDEEDD